MVRILVVEDDEGSREALSLLLAHSGYQVESAATVSEALDHLSPPPGWIISDLMLPDLAGEALIREIRRRRLPCRILVITGVRDERRLEELERLNPEAVLTKPVSLGKILDELQPDKEPE